MVRRVPAGEAPVTEGCFRYMLLKIYDLYRHPTHKCVCGWLGGSMGKVRLND